MSPLYLLTFLPGAAAGGAICAFLRRLPAHDEDWEGGGPGSIRLLPAALAVGILFVLTTAKHGFGAEGILGCLLTVPLVGLALYDAATGIIPSQLTFAVFLLGALRTATDAGNLTSHLIGLASVAGPLWLLYLLSKGRAIGGGDIKLMAGCGLYLGWAGALAAFILGCALGSFIHLARMRFAGASRTLAMGPYLAAGTLIAMLWGRELIAWYMGLFRI